MIRYIKLFRYCFGEKRGRGVMGIVINIDLVWTSFWKVGISLKMNSGGNISS